MKQALAFVAILLTVTPGRAIASWFESCELTGTVVNVTSRKKLFGRQPRDVSLSVRAAQRTKDRLGEASYTSCHEHIGTDQQLQIAVPRSTRINVGGILTVVRTAVDGTNINTGETSTTVEFRFVGYQGITSERW
ncbi:hypothetical protein GCM10010080_31050 [Thermomonas carbonis]|nr:hypothetical protein GCM10010080_31050 [Thermomonas carbonis]